MASKYYVVWQGRKPGIFTNWNSCKAQVDGFAGAKFKSFKTLTEAEAALHGRSNSSAAVRSANGAPRSGKTPAKRRSNGSSVKTYTANDIAALAIDTKIYTDGGCEPNPGKAGSGLAVYRSDRLDSLWYGLYNPNGTNNTAELNALHQALIMAEEELKQDRSVAIFCDSKYAIQCVTQWAINWQKKGWKKAGGEIKNLELIKQMFTLHQTLKDKVQVLHVNGHVGVEGNELADRMSILAVASKTQDFKLYQEIINIKAVLAMRAG